MASRLSVYFFLLFILLAIVASAARNTPAITPIASKERNTRKMATNVHFAEARSKDDNMIHRLRAGHEEMIAIQDYGDARANHRHDPHHPLAVKGNSKELDG